MKLFGSSGIRGLANVEVTVDLALKVGMALGRSKKTAVIGRDPRVAGEMIEHALISGLMSAGCNVVRAGILTTPTLAYAARNYDCGVMVTASHNPAQDVGIKLWNPDGMAFDSTQQEEIEYIIEKEDFVNVPWNRIGEITSYENAVRDHIDMIQSHSTGAPIRVVVDCGGGAGGTITPFLLREMGCEVITLNSQIDGHFPARNPEPKDSNLWMLKRAVTEFKAELGIAHDGDADRMMAVDENGIFVSGDEMLAIFARYECKDNPKVVVPVDTSMIVDDALPGSTIIHTRVGDVYVAEEMKKQKADFGGEPSGSWIFPRISYCPDGIYAAALLVDIVKEKKLSVLREELPQYPTLRSTVECDNSRKSEVMKAISSRLASMGEVSSIDGIRVDMEDGWVLVRPSGTEAKIRITAEARKNVEELHAKVETIVKECLQ
ncbi:phosphoglucosamine mutase [Methanolobus mangrovi]|uniref:Phosphoglucosamine mutase n=1 Tax=Methanolobus mangrovi TaxID=3072977 RepID=A0AA51UIN3_9EURY|nr:phosphoglucosamine mutase [Methanolobus mangrovi]WMW22406.1 phosphoglucosamine mutase [Methanolobus mangrovi]